MSIQQKKDIKSTFIDFANNKVSFTECFNAFFDTLNIELQASSSVSIDFKDLYKEAMNLDDSDSMPKYLENIYQNIQDTFFLGTINDETLTQNALDVDISKLNHKNYEGFALFGVNLKPKGDNKLYSRTELAGLTRGLNKLSFDNPVIAFIRQGDFLSISTCERNKYVHFKTEIKRGEKLVKVSMIHNINLKKPHTGHINIIEGMNFDNCNTYNAVYDKWMEVFSTKLLTKQFYIELFKWYCWALSEDVKVTYPNDPNTTKDDRIIDKHIIRLITRLIFVWFMRAKGLIPTNLFNIDELNKILVDFDPLDYKKSNYYNAILQNLFFATLNQEIDKRRFVTDSSYRGKSKDFSVNNLYRDNKKATWFKISKEDVLKMFSTIPYLNGGLFECLDEPNQYSDGFSRDDMTQKRAFVPNVLFFHPVNGIISILKSYYFTIEENTPLEQEVSLDPELLGKVFENLLGAYNPETQETERKTSGAFYTPREIVEYMSNQAIINYLSINIYDEGDERTDFENRLGLLLNYNIEEPEFSSKEIEQSLKLISNCKILDPACGSGAFPMGIMQRLVHILTYMDKDNSKWKELLIKKATDQTSNAYQMSSEEERNEELERIKDSFNNSIRRPDYARKLYVIQNCIYCTDIQNIAIQISKLRFFISLVCDLTPQENLPNFGIPTLPNLEAKFVCADSLLDAEIKKYDQVNEKKDNELALGDWGDLQLNKLRKDLANLREKLFYANTYHKKQKIKEEEANKRKEIADYLSTKANGDNEKIERLQEQIKKDKLDLSLIKGEKIEVKEEIVHATLFDAGKKVKKTFDANKKLRDKLTKRINDSELDLAYEIKKHIAYQNAVKQLAEWNLYDKINKANFFYPQWMFGVKDFDIVIGNPPYVQLQKDSSNKDSDGQIIKYGDYYQNSNYETFTKTGDLYCLFYERASQLLKPNGFCCFITSNKWMRAGYGEQTRSFFANNTNPLLLVDFAGVKVFESATVDTNILLFQNCENKGKTLTCVTKNMSKNDLSNLSLFVQQHSDISTFNNSDSWVILSPIEQSIKHKIESVGTPLKDWDINIYRGVLTGYNEAFIISTEKRNEILSNCKTEEEKNRTAELIRPILRGRDIKRYGYDWANLWLINTHNGVKGKFPRININEYPALKQHLDKYWDKIEKRADQGDTPYNLRNCAYLEDFDKPKVVYPNMTKYLPFLYDEQKFVTNQKCFIITGRNLAFLTAFFNSSLFKYCFRDSFPELQGGTRELSKIFFDKIPVLQVSDNIESQFRKYVVDIQKQYSKEKAIQIDDLIFDLYSLSEEERNLIGFIEIQ